jgi:two-component system, NtrC family, sensor histidine kinase HydH
VIAIKKSQSKFILIAILIGGITFFHYFTESKVHHHHIFYQGLYFLPVILAGSWFGLRGALGASATVTLLYLPFTITHWRGFSSDDLNSILEIVLYNVVAVILGKLTDRERVADIRLREAERLAAMGKAVSGLAHDLKTPLIAIHGLSRLVQKELEGCGQHQVKLDMIVEESQRLEKMVNEMLDFSRSLELHPSKEDMNRIVGQCVEIVAGPASEKRVSVHSQLQDLPPFAFDPVRMKQVLINLLINAIEASPRGGTVVVSVYRRRRTAILDVADEGPGIPTEHRREIFFPFFTTKKEGTGLGLCIAKKIIEAHEGQLEALDNPGRGAIFRIEIPLNQR